jgi:hypothetical protein
MMVRCDPVFLRCSLAVDVSAANSLRRLVQHLHNDLTLCHRYAGVRGRFFAVQISRS